MFRLCYGACNNSRKLERRQEGKSILNLVSGVICFVGLVKETDMASEVKLETKTCSIFDADSFKKITKGIHVSQLMKLKQVSAPSEDVSQMLQELNVSARLFCSFCNVSFPDQTQQRQHYKLDWHRYNLKQHLAHKKLISEEKFSQIAENDEVSSISGSESDSSDTELTESEEASLSDERVSHLLARRARVLFENESGHLLAVYQCLLHDKKSEVPSEDQLVSLTHQLITQNSWMIIMLGGGHMAAAVFKGLEAVRHKTFHSYTVRAKQGGSQSSRDNTGRHTKSAGASLRRYNEQALTQHVQDILTAWAVDVAACHLIFVRAVGPFNRGVLFGGKSPPLSKTDARLRTIPFPTRRATYSEVQRVHALLATITVYDSAEMFRSSLASPRRSLVREELPATPESPRARRIDRAKSRQSPDRALPPHVELLATYDSSETDTEIDCQLVLQENEISFNDSLIEFEDTVPKKAKKKKKKKEPTPEQELSEELRTFRQKVFAACELGDKSLLSAALEQEGAVISGDDLAVTLNHVDTTGLSLLQSAAQHAFRDIVWLLLENGANPSIKDKKAMTAYDFAPDKETRNVFRRFMGEFPEKYDYSKSHIPSALTTDVEQVQAEKKREARKAKRLKEKEKRIADEPRRKEEEEKQRYLELSDREKRALAAERRILAVAGNSKLALTRCYVCALNITGKVPFTYENYLFCSMPCLKAHRAKHKQTL